MPDASLIVYDGECIFCQNYVRLVRLREAVGKVELLNSRSNDPRIARYWRDGYDLNEGMLFVHEGHIYHGSDAIHKIAQLCSPETRFNRLNGSLFSSATIAGLAYPALKLGRLLTLRLRGRKLIDKP